MITYHEWRNATSPWSVLYSYRMHSRKHRLLHCAVARAVSSLFPQAWMTRAVEQAEQYADKAIGREALSDYEISLRREGWSDKYRGHRLAVTPQGVMVLNERWTFFVVYRCVQVLPKLPGVVHGRIFSTLSGPREASLARDLVYPGHLWGDTPESQVAAYRTPLVLELARVAYADRTTPYGNLDPMRLLVLADALEEAGCTSSLVLQHLRGHEHCPDCLGEGGRCEGCSDGPCGGWTRLQSEHVYGCWVIDALLGRGP